jgi:hypothetical protein
MNKTIEERLTDLERRFRPIEYVLYRSEFEARIEDAKGIEMDSNGKDYIVTVQFETDKGSYTKVFELKAYTEKQACYLCDVDIMKPNLDKVKQMGKIKWYRILNKTATLNKK